jgi:TRAP-type transport system small permease protein
MKEWCRRLAEIVAGAAGLGAGVLFLINIANILMGVFARYVFRSSPIWTEELSRFILVWMVLIAATPTLVHGEHMRIDLVIKRMPGWAAFAAALVRHGTVLGAALFMTIRGWSYANGMWNFTTMGLQIPKAIPLFVVSFGFGIFLLVYGLLLLAGDVERYDPEHPEGAAI